MAFDGIITMAVTHEIKRDLIDSRVDKIHLPTEETCLITFKSGREKRRLFISCETRSASVREVKRNTENPETPFPFCMLLRKHLTGSRLISVRQEGCDRIMELEFERQDELGLMVRKKLIIEIMGKHSNMILTSPDDSERILGSIKAVPSGINRMREILPGRFYTYPPSQDKVPFTEATAGDLSGSAEGDFSGAGAASGGTLLSGKDILRRIGGISPQVADELASLGTPEERYEALLSVVKTIEDGSYTPRVYLDKSGMPREFHIMDLKAYEEEGSVREFGTVSEAADYYFENREEMSAISQKVSELSRVAKASLEKAELKKQRLSEDILRAEDSGDLKLYGELLTANIGIVKQGMKEITLQNYYTGEDVTIPLDPRWTASMNAQNYYKRYNKSKTAVTEKKAQLEETDRNIEYLESVITFIEHADTMTELIKLREELEDAGFLKRKEQRKSRKSKFKASPRKYKTSDGFTVLVGRNNRENDVLTFETAEKGDYWLHTKDIPGSHVILRMGGAEITETAIYEAASLAALYSKAGASKNVPVDYVPVRFVKKPNGAKPGMVIFTHNRTVFVDPKEP